MRVIKPTEVRGGISCVGGRGEAHTGFWWEYLREKGHLCDLGKDRRIMVEWILKKLVQGHQLD
jgi:hypothetical protein